MNRSTHNKDQNGHSEADVNTIFRGFWTEVFIDNIAYESMVINWHGKSTTNYRPDQSKMLSERLTFRKCAQLSCDQKSRMGVGSRKVSHLI